MAFSRAIITKIEEGVFLIDDAHESTCYLICGKDKALLFDTANGREDLHEVVRSLTDLPLIVVDSHGHPDHVAGNKYFDHAYLHPADLPVVEGFLDAENRKTPLLPLEIGQVFDLGGVKLEVVPLQGHTPGSVGLLDREKRILFTGDAVNTHLWMQLDHGLKIADLREMLLDLKANFGGTFDRVFHGHARAAREAELVDTLINACDELLSGKNADDPDYKWFGGVCKKHLLSENPDECIVYTVDKL